jgi:hypothetical protein
MEWIIIAVVFVGLAVLVALYVARARESKDIRISGRFDFADFKDRELSKRGVFDRTKWWK